jgi:hypothetical protein
LSKTRIKFLGRDVICESLSMRLYSTGRLWSAWLVAEPKLGEWVMELVVGKIACRCIRAKIS